jgi:lipid-binding SYLF domain-containing protein
MSPILRPLLAILIVTAVVFSAFVPTPGIAGSAAEIDSNVDQALSDLYRQSSEAKALAKRAKGILVFPKIIKAGLLIGAQAGEGALRVNAETTGYYTNVAASYGLQVGVQWFGYAMFFMNESALKYLEKSAGWEIGSGPSIVVLDKGAAGSLTTSSLKDDIYVFFFDQKGLMAGLGLQGTKITEFTPD